MQLHLPMERDDRLPVIRRTLRAAFGRVLDAGRHKPIDQLVKSLISSRTYDSVSGLAYERLRARFRPWERLAQARLEEVLAILKIVEHADVKSDWLIKALQKIIKETGELRLDFLGGWNVQEAMAWLQQLPGVGPKVAAAVLNFSTLRKRVMVVDTHVKRVSGRLDLAPETADPGRVAEILLDAVPDDLYELHWLLKRLGQNHCHAGRPACGGCPLADLCPTEPRHRLRLPGEDRTRAPANENRPAAKAPLQLLRRRIARIERRSGFEGSWPRLSAGPSFGADDLDLAFGGRGLPAGVHQLSGAPDQDLSAPFGFALALSALKTGDDRLLLVQEQDAVREAGAPYAPGLKAFGLDPRRAAFVTVQSGAEVLRVIDEALKHAAARTLIAELRRGERLADLSLTRRLNLSVYRTGATLFLVTPTLDQTSAALTRWRVAPAPSRARKRRLGPPVFNLSLVRNRLGPTGQWILEWDAHERRFRSPTPLPAPLVRPPAHRPPAEALRRVRDAASGDRRQAG